MKREIKKNKGFSLVELIIVIAIMVILGAIIAPQYFKHVNNAKKSSDIEQAARISSAISAEYANEQAKGTTTSKFKTYDSTVATPVVVWTAVSEIKDVVGTVANSKVEPKNVFFYSLSENGDVRIGVAVSTATTVENTHIIAPLNDAAADWK